MERIASLTDEDIEKVCPTWSKIEEFHGTVSPENLADYLKALRAFLNERKGPYFLINGL